MGKESNGKLAFLYTLLNRNNGKISILVYRKPTHTNQYLTTTSTTKQVAGEVFFPSSLIEHIPLSPIKMTQPKKTLE